MAVREGMITTSAMRQIEEASRVITKDVLYDGGTKSDAVTFIKRLVKKGVRSA